MAVQGVFEATKPADTYVDSSRKVSQVNEANDVDQTDGNKSAAADLNFETFLKLLTVQLEYQDPLNPMEDTEWTTQLAQYSSLEAQLESNELLEKLAAAENLSQEALAISYIGKEALVPGSITATNGETPVSINYKQENVSAQTVIEIREVVESTDADGNVSQRPGDVVRSIEGTTFQGRNEVIWDAKDGDGNPVNPGFYIFSVSASGSDGEAVIAKEYTYGSINSTETSVEGDMILSTTDGRVTKLDDILLVRQASSSGSPSGEQQEEQPETEDNV